MCTAWNFDVSHLALFGTESPGLWEVLCETMCDCLVRGGHWTGPATCGCPDVFTSEVATLSHFGKGTVLWLWQLMGAGRRQCPLFREDGSIWEAKEIRNSEDILLIWVCCHLTVLGIWVGLSKSNVFKGDFTKMEYSSLISCHPKHNIPRLKKLVFYF